MTPERWQQINRVFHAALEHEPPHRAAFLAQVGADDEPLRLEVTSLLASHEQADSFIETLASDLAAELLAEDRPGLVRGQLVGAFRIEEVLARGGMGEVYLADDTRLGRKVALKLLPSQFTINVDRVHRFEQEARSASALNHPNIVTIHEIGHSDSLHFIATEFVDGVTLREQMTKTRLTFGEVLDVAVQVASALQAAHEAGIVHRDIKPENIMLRRDGFVKVLDFGLAKLASQSEHRFEITGPIQSMVQTNPGVVMGTVGYMSPEQARQQDVDARSDIWSLGVVLHEIIAGRAPFTGDTPSLVIDSIVKSEPLTLSLDPDLPPELDRIVAKALRKEKSERYQTASDMLIDLRNLKEELTVASRLKQFRKSGANVDESVNLRDLGRTQAVGDSPTNTIHVLKRKTESVDYFVREIKRHKIVSAAILFVLLVGAMSLTYSLRNRSQTKLSVSPKKSIAVLPLRPINAVDHNDLYEIGIADALILRLSSMKGFVVRNLNATRAYTNIEQDPITAGKEQQVDYVLTANYQLDNGEIRITAQLLNVANGQSEQTYKIEKNVSSIFVMQDEIAAELGNKLLGQFATTSKGPIAKRSTNNEDAYRLYLHGMYLANNRTSVDAQKAVEALEQAVSLDPNYALAWAGLAYAQRTIGSRGNTYEAHQKSIEAINRALTLDPNLSEAHSALCENQYFYDWDFVAAETECRRAIELNPDSAQAHEIYSRYLMSRGRHEEAIAEIKNAIDLDPYSRFVQRNYGRALFYARRYREAADQLKRVLAMDQNFTSAYSWLTSALALQGNESEAFEWLKKLMALRNVDQVTVRAFETAFQTSGWHGVLREWVTRFDKVGGDDNDGAAYNAQIGNKDQAFEYLEKLYQQRASWLTYLQVDPRFDPLRDDPRFVELVRRVESKSR